MKNYFYIFLGIDLIKPIDEKNVKIVENIKKNINKNNLLTISIEKNKKIHTKKNINLILLKNNYFGKFGQFVILIGYLFIYRFKKIKKKINLNIIWSGFGIIDFFILLLCRLFLINSTYTIINKKQTNYPFLGLARKIIVFSPDLLNLVKSKNKQSYFLSPRISIKKFDRNIKKNLFLFTTVPIYQKNFTKRGVYHLFKLAKYIESKNYKIKFLILNRWVEGSNFLENLKIKYQVNNIEFVHGSVKDIGKYYSMAEALINLDYGPETPQFSLSIAEAIICSCPIISISKTWLTNKIKKNKAGLISGKKNINLFNSIKKLHNNLTSYEENCMRLSRTLFPKSFEREYIKIINQ